MEHFRLTKVVDGQDVNIRLQVKKWFGWRTFKLIVCTSRNCNAVLAKMRRAICYLNDVV